MARKAERIRDLYDQTVSHYDERYRNIQFSKFSETSVRWEDRDVVLDVGCGTGLLIEYMTIEPIIFVGVDLSVNMLKVARRKSSWPIFIAGDVRKLPLKQEVFSKVVSFSVLQNIPDPREVIGEIFRVSKRASSVLITALRKRITIESLVNWTRKEAEKRRRSVEIEQLNLSLEDVGIKCKSEAMDIS